eukprot:gene5121-7134_t
MSTSVPISTAEAEMIHSAIQNIFNSTKCYDLMQNSSKGTVFETTIPFQLAFFALVEHDTDVAPLWDPEKRLFVGLMTISDYIQSLRIWRTHNIPTTELTSRSISDMLLASPLKFRHTGFLPIDAEDSVNQMCLLLLRTDNDYVPVIDADNGHLVSILGYLDIIHLLDQAAKQHPNLFGMSIQQCGVGTFQNIVTAPKHARLYEVLDAMEQRKISALPIVDESNKVIGIYHRTDVSFIIKATDPDAVIGNLSNYKVEDSLTLKESLMQSGELSTTFEGLVTCKLSDPLKNVVNSMMMARSTRAVIVDDDENCFGIFTVKDLIKFYFNADSK